MSDNNYIANFINDLELRSALLTLARNIESAANLERAYMIGARHLGIAYLRHGRSAVMDALEDALCDRCDGQGRAWAGTPCGGCNGTGLLR